MSTTGVLTATIVIEWSNLKLNANGHSPASIDDRVKRRVEMK